MPHKIVHTWHTNCSNCGGNASMSEDQHIRGGPDPGGPQGPRYPRSYLDQTNGCGAAFDEPIQHATVAGHRRADT